MPQMAPSLWHFILLTTLIMMLTSLSINYFYTNLMVPTITLKNLTLNTNKWMW